MPSHSYSFDTLPTDSVSTTRDALNGLAVGDAFGAQFFVPANRPALHERRLPAGPWPWTDDTEMACSVYQTVLRHGTVDQEELAQSFARHHDFDRGYGPAMNRLLRLVRQGGNWHELAAGLFDGQGSWGNGAAMRVAPLGARYPTDPVQAARQAVLSAEVTHTHPEAIAGAVAVAASRAAHGRTRPVTGADLIDAVLDHTPPSRVRDGIVEARQLLDQPHPELAAHRLGNGCQVSAVDTVPFTLWCAARHLTDYEAALWATASAGGDVDTTCAIVGGIVAARVGTEGIPTAWRDCVETLPAWLHGHRSWQTVHTTSVADRHPCVCCGHLVHDEPRGSHDLCPVCFWEGRPGATALADDDRRQPHPADRGAAQRAAPRRVRPARSALHPPTASRRAPGPFLASDRPAAGLLRGPGRPRSLARLPAGSLLVAAIVLAARTEMNGTSLLTTRPDRVEGLLGATDDDLTEHLKPLAA